MMKTAPPFPLTREQASRLRGYLQTYRRYALASLLPSIERNTTLRILQTIQGKLIEIMDQQIVPLHLVLTTEESSALKMSIIELLLLYSRQPLSAERNAALADLALLRASLKSY
jgi:hypothetical protein